METESLDEATRLRPLAEWDLDDGCCMWWKFPIEEPPYIGDPTWEDWPGYHTHWTPILLIPRECWPDESEWILPPGGDE